jgi:hypothetical protein
VKPINLNKARKARTKVKKRAEADENAVFFGLSKAQRDAARAEAARSAARHAGHRRDDAPTGAAAPGGGDPDTREGGRAPKSR